MQENPPAPEASSAATSHDVIPELLPLGPRITRGILYGIAYLSCISWVINVAIGVLVSLFLLMALALGDDPWNHGAWACMGIAAVDVATLLYQRRGYLAKSLDPHANRMILILTALSLALGGLLFIPDLLVLGEKLSLEASLQLLALRSSVLLASGLPYLLQRIPWAGNLPSRR